MYLKGQRQPVIAVPREVGLGHPSPLLADAAAAVGASAAAAAVCAPDRLVQAQAPAADRPWGAAAAPAQAAGAAGDGAGGSGSGVRPGFRTEVTTDKAGAAVVRVVIDLSVERRDNPEIIALEAGRALSRPSRTPTS